MKSNSSHNGQHDLQNGGSDERYRISRRRFLIAGGATAAAVAGTAFYLLSEEPAVEPGVFGETAVASNRPSSPWADTMPTLSPQEAAAMRHLRHRRQFVDGFVDSPCDSYESCEHDCIRALFAHEQ